MSVNSIPDIDGYTLGEAKAILERAGITICNIRITSPPKHMCRDFDDSSRVIRSKTVDCDSVELIICKPLKT